ncbi:P-loop containing nucleoside triphosphate hydrolase protein [Penicillium lagena]|uniref:P-loop containing nucleoside triphosphate hydrolase protein n=1 Tax=Penicillium lagena TaxID=94218 RepID=UPI002540DABA|nr:P-loop containing nucleoside triphosphate hydrolase protein [Penicillium lagena]KAJ5620527.1 P-loop containing nucleoside triphosphate hydrolase protein [Penicillium lagena]
MTSISFGKENSGLQAGIVNGNVTAQFYLPAERPETPPKPLSTVPFRRDPDFVDRGRLLYQIHEKSSTPGARIALVGLGGVGKSQLAIEYCYRVRDRSPETWVFWIHASNATRFEQNCREIADRVKIPGRQNSRMNVSKLLYDWLNDAMTGEWVLVLDNLDDDEFLHAISSVEQDGLRGDQSDVLGRSIWSYFAQSLKGSIIITSRSRSVALRIVEDYDIIQVEPMDETHAISLFEKKLGAQANREDVIQLTTALEFMPLAIVQAAAYIKQRAPRQSVTQYLEKFQRNDRQKIGLLDYEGGNLRRDPGAKNSILVTWQLSFDYIREKRPSAADMLSLMSFFDRQGIPDSVLRENNGTRCDIRSLPTHDRDEANNISDREDSGSESSEVDIFEDDIVVLRDYSLISISADGTNFEMHRLVQLATQKWLKAHKQLERWKGCFIRRLCRSFPAGTFEHWPRCQLLFAHVLCAIKQQPNSEALLEEWALLLHKAASFALARGNFVDSETMAEKSTAARGRLLGPEHPDTLISMSNLASTYHNQGRWKEADELGVQVVEGSNLASMYRYQGRFQEAEELEVQVIEVIETREQVLGPEHPDTLTSMSNLASIHRNQGRFKESEELEVQVIERFKRVLGPDHPHTLISMANLASTYRYQGRFKESEELDVQVMEIRKQVLGLEHLSTLTSIANLASTYWSQGRFQEAEELELQVMESSKQVLGPDHPDTLTSMAKLASKYQDQGRFQEAEELEVQVMKGYKQVLGPEHPDSLISIANLASTYWCQGRFKEAEELELQVMESSKQVLGPDHPDTLTSMANLAQTLRSSGQDKPALLLMAECVRLRDRKLGPDHPDTVSSKSALNKWRGIGAPPSSQSTEGPTETKEEEQTKPNSTESDERVSRTGRTS